MCRWLILFVLLLSCTEKEIVKDEVVLKWHTITTPIRIEPTTFVFKLTNGRGDHINQASIELEATMSHPGMVPVAGKAKFKADGEYEATITPTMPGSWIMFLKITTTDKKLIDKEFSFEIAR